MNPLRFLQLIGVLILLSACGASRNIRIDNYLLQSSCNQQNRYAYTKEELPVDLHQKSLDTLLLTTISFESLNVANAIGIIDKLEAYVKVKREYLRKPTLENRLDYIELSSFIKNRINLASLEISATASEMDCEEERTSQIADYLKRKEDDKETKLTVSSIVVGATGAILTAAIEKSKPEKAVGLSTGITEAFLGVMILLNKKKIEFSHPRNSLKEIWEGREVSDIFPPSIWYYLNYYDPNGKIPSSRRVELIQKWVNFGQISDIKSKKKSQLLNLYFGEGGKYTAEQLANRANMYDQLESYINLMKQDLNKLSFEFEKLEKL